MGGAAVDPKNERRAERERMVEEQIADREIRDPAVLEAMRRVPRHRFMPEMYASEAYADHPVPIGWDQTISQPYIVAFMTEAAQVSALGSHAKVLEIGSGSGYQAAVLAELGAEVWGIEIVAPLAERAAEVLAALGYDRVHVRAGDGYRGEPSEAPFDAILVTAAAPRVPEPLLEQLKIGGRLVIPVGTFTQDIWVITRKAHGYQRDRVLPVRFVPMTGEVQSSD